jgi:hypothetical protein
LTFSIFSEIIIYSVVLSPSPKANPCHCLTKINLLYALPRHAANRSHRIASTSHGISSHLALYMIGITIPIIIKHDHHNLLRGALDLQLRPHPTMAYSLGFLLVAILVCACALSAQAAIDPWWQGMRSGWPGTDVCTVIMPRRQGG